MKYVYASRPRSRRRFARWAVKVWGVDSTSKTVREIAEEGIERYVDFLRLVGAPLTLSEVGIPGDSATLDKLADHAGDVGGSYRRHHPRRCARHPRILRDAGRVLRMYQVYRGMEAPKT